MPDSAVSTAKVSFLVHLLLEGLQRSSGLLFVATREGLGCSRQLAAIPFALSRVVAGSVGVLLRFQKEGRCPLPCVRWGCFLSAVGVGFCFLATDIVWFSVFWGIIFGAGIGLASPLLVSELTKRKDCSAKSPLRLTGASFGCIVLPFIINGLVEHYGLNGCYSILSGVILNCLPLILIADYQIQFQWTSIKWRLRSRSKRYEVSKKEEISSNVSVYKRRGIKEFCNQSFIQNLEPDTIEKASDGGSRSSHCTEYIDILQPIIEAKLEMAKDQVNDREPFGLEINSQNMKRCEHGMPFSNELSELANDVQEYEKNRTMYEKSFSDNDVVRDSVEASEKSISSQNNEGIEIIWSDNDSFEAHGRSNSSQNNDEQEIPLDNNDSLKAHVKSNSSQNDEEQEIPSNNNDSLKAHKKSNSSQNNEEHEIPSNNNDSSEARKKSNSSQNNEGMEIISSDSDSLEAHEKSKSSQNNEAQEIPSNSNDSLEAREKSNSFQNNEAQEIPLNNNDSLKAHKKSNNSQNNKAQEIPSNSNDSLEAHEKSKSSQNNEAQEIPLNNNDSLKAHKKSNNSQNNEEQGIPSNSNDSLEAREKSNGFQNNEEIEITSNNNASLESRKKSHIYQKNKEQGIKLCTNNSFKVCEKSHISQNDIEKTTSCNKDSLKDCINSSSLKNAKEQVITSCNNGALEACEKSVYSTNNKEHEIAASYNDKNQSDFSFSGINIEKTSEKGVNETDNLSEASPPTIACTSQNFQIKTDTPNPAKELRTNFPLEIKVHVVECTITTAENFAEILSNKGPSASRKGYRRHSNSLITACYENIDFTQLFLNGKSSPLHKQQWNQASRMCLISEDGESDPGPVNRASGSREVQTQTGVESPSMGKRLFRGFQRLARPSCLAIIYASVIYEFSLAVLLTIFSDFARGTGDVTVTSNVVLVVFGLGGVVGQLSFSHWGSRLMVDGSHAAAAVMFMLNGLAVAGILWSATVAWLSGFYALLGFVESGVMITLPKLTLDYTDHKADELLSVTCNCLSVLAFLCIPCAIGQSRDVTGDYDGLLQVISCMSVLCAVLCYFLPKWNGGRNSQEEFHRNAENVV